MDIQVKSSNGIQLVPIRSRLMSQRRVFLEGEITPNGAVEFTMQILYLNNEDSSAPIHVFINSPGGEINSGMLMYDVIQSSKAPIHAYCIGRAYSMAAALLACAQRRYILPNSEVMIHQPMLGSGISGNVTSIKSISDNLLETKKRMNLLLAKHTGKTEEEIDQATSFDNFLSAQAAVRFGLVDEVMDFKSMMEVTQCLSI